ncbi:MAG: L-2-hydroxyglutarate oxidase [Chloroflexota bacterium]
MRQYDVAIVGGGIVGLATAMRLLEKYPRLTVAILEKEDRIAAHQSGHNSGVLHSGIYYKPGSLKARLCVRGKELLLRFCDKHDIPYKLCGKVIVALDESELPRLQDLYQRGLTNGVPGVELIGPERLRELEPHAAGIQAIYSPNTGVIDYVRVAEAYARVVREKGGVILTNHEVTGIIKGSPVVLETTGGDMEADYLITCAGLQSDRLARKTGAPDNLRIVPFRGDYYTLKPEKAYLCRSLIYPVPDPAFPFLGVHFTIRMDGQVWAGPNAVLAFAREGYSRFQFNAGDLLEVLGYSGFRHLARKYWRMGLSEMYRDYSKSAFVAAMQAYVPEVTGDDVVFGPSGVRAQAMASDGSLVDDFSILNAKNIIHLRNAPSPAATSSLAIGDTIVGAAGKAFDLAGS